MAKALRFNDGKPKLSYFLEFGNPQEVIARIMEFGAAKYEDGNWRLGGKPDREYLDSALRHLRKHFQEGEVYDKDSGCSHIGHAIWNLLALHELNHPDEIIDEPLFRKQCEYWRAKKAEQASPSWDPADGPSIRKAIEKTRQMGMSESVIEQMAALNAINESEEVKVEVSNVKPSRETYREIGRAVHEAMKSPLDEDEDEEAVGTPMHECPDCGAQWDGGSAECGLCANGPIVSDGVTFSDYKRWKKYLATLRTKVDEVRVDVTNVESPDKVVDDVASQLREAFRAGRLEEVPGEQTNGPSILLDDTEVLVMLNGEECMMPKGHIDRILEVLRAKVAEEKSAVDAKVTFADPNFVCFNCLARWTLDEDGLLADECIECGGGIEEVLGRETFLDLGDLVEYPEIDEDTPSEEGDTRKFICNNCKCPWPFSGGCVDSICPVCGAPGDEWCREIDEDAPGAAPEAQDVESPSQMPETQQQPPEEPSGYMDLQETCPECFTALLDGASICHVCGGKSTFVENLRCPRCGLEWASFDTTSPYCSCCGDHGHPMSDYDFWNPLAEGEDEDADNSLFSAEALSRTIKDISGWDPSQIPDARYMFNQCHIFPQFIPWRDNKAKMFIDGKHFADVDSFTITADVESICDDGNPAGYDLPEYRYTPMNTTMTFEIPDRDDLKVPAFREIIDEMSEKLNRKLERDFFSAYYSMGCGVLPMTFPETAAGLDPEAVDQVLTEANEKWEAKE